MYFCLFHPSLRLSFCLFWRWASFRSVLKLFCRSNAKYCWAALLIRHTHTHTHTKRHMRAHTYTHAHSQTHTQRSAGLGEKCGLFLCSFWWLPLYWWNRMQRTLAQDRVSQNRGEERQNQTAASLTAGKLCLNIRCHTHFHWHFTSTSRKIWPSGIVNIHLLFTQLANFW